jgi:crotonobetainyl-CoA:carnitine CoA-transferase CaiB-like acyl-CoA transferase
LCEVLGHPEWTTVPEFRTDGLRTRHREDLAAQIESITITRPQQEWLAIFDANNIPCGPINDYAQVFSDPQVLARDLVIDVDHPTLGSMRMLGSPIKMSATPPDVRRRAPLLGEHSEDILRDAGFAPDDIKELLKTSSG